MLTKLNNWRNIHLLPSGTHILDPAKIYYEDPDQSTIIV